MCYNELHTAVYILHFNSWKQRKQWGRDAAFEKKGFRSFCVCSDRTAPDGVYTTETAKRHEEKWLTCCASFGYLTPTGLFSNLDLNLSTPQTW